MRTDQSPAANESLRMRTLARRPLLLAAAALIATGALGLTFGGNVPFAAAETAETQTIDTPYGRAPLSFADLVEKVSPAVVSSTVRVPPPNAAATYAPPIKPAAGAPIGMAK